MTITMFGIPNCDTVKRAKDWLNTNGVAFEFHDYKKAGVPAEKLRQWVADLGWEVLLNRAGTTFKKLSELETADIDADKAVSLMMAYPSVIKRPVLDLGDRRIVGFKPETYIEAFSVS